MATEDGVWGAHCLTAVGNRRLGLVLDVDHGKYTLDGHMIFAPHAERWDDILRAYMMICDGDGDGDGNGGDGRSGGERDQVRRGWPGVTYYGEVFPIVGVTHDFLVHSAHHVLRHAVIIAARDREQKSLFYEGAIAEEDDFEEAAAGAQSVSKLVAAILGKSDTRSVPAPVPPAPAPAPAPPSRKAADHYDDDDGTTEPQLSAIDAVNDAIQAEQEIFKKKLGREHTKATLVEYAMEIGIHIDPRLKKSQMLDRIVTFACDHGMIVFEE